MDAFTPDLEAACLRALRAAWDELNLARFRGALSPPALILSDALSRLGLWDSPARTIQLARSLVLTHPWPLVIEVLKHEMAHQYVDEVLHAGGEPPHGPTFQALCDKLGIDGSSGGLPAAAAADSRPNRLIERVAKLLALAASPNEHEARSAMAAAQRLMLLHNIDVARDLTARRYAYRHLGVPTGRLFEAERILAGMLGAHFFVQCIWIPVWRPLEGKRGTVLEVCGTPENLELAAHTHAFLLGTADRLWQAYRRAHGAPGRDRHAYQAGVMAGFRETLERQAQRHREEALVWKGDADLMRYYRRRHPHIRSVSYSASPHSSAHQAGRAAGRQIVLHKPVAPPSASTGRRLLNGR